MREPSVPLLDPVRHEAELGQLRAEIDRFDGWILALLRARGEVVLDIARLKRRHGLQSRDQNREEERLRALTRVPPKPFSVEAIRQIFQAVFHACLRLQETDPFEEERTE